MALPALIICNGGNPVFRRIAAECGWLNGARLPDTVYDPPLYFADQNYHKPDRGEYMRALAEHKPEMATVLDWEQPSQEGEVMAWAVEAAQYVQRVIIIPKLPGTIDSIPSSIGGADVVLGYSVPTSYGGTEVPLWEFGSRPVHLLGGSPHRQMQLAWYLNVVSADGGMAQQQARKCRFWSRQKGSKGHWVQLSEAGDSRGQDANTAAFRRSCVNILEAWRRGGAD